MRRELQVTTIATPGLGDRSYIISSSGTAVVIDPQRDVDRITDYLRAYDLEVAVVCETHIHNDYVTGGLVLARLTGAEYAVGSADDVSFDRRGVHDGDVIDLGPLRVQAMATPGHTPTHLAYLVEEAEEAAVFTGGSMLFATVGRTDLIGPEMTEALTREQYRSVRRLAELLPGRTEVFPTHGFGSFCASAGGGSRTEGTIALEREENLACTTQVEDDFVATLMDGFAAFPPYYAHMAHLNRAGPLAPDLGRPSTATPDDLAARISRGEWVVDVRPPTAFAEGHLAGSVSVDGGGAIATYLGWAIPWGTPLSLVADTEEQIADAQRELVRIGIDRPLAMATGGVDTFAEGQDIQSYPAVRFADLEANPDVTVVDVRRADEWDAGHIEGALHMRMEQLADHAADLPAGELWVHCASGFRASIASSLIARAGKQVVYINDSWDNVGDSNRPTT